MSTARRSGDEISIDRIDKISSDGLDKMVRSLIQESNLDQRIAKDNAFFPSFMANLSRGLDEAFARQNPRALDEIHRSLYFLYEQNFASPADAESANQFHPFLVRVRTDIERTWEKCEIARARVHEDGIPKEPAAFAQDFKDRCGRHRLSRHPLFDFLELKATRGELVEFFLHDRALILRFRDLVSMAMVGADEEVRGELATNLWDEMGNGDPALRHTVLFQRLLNYVGVDTSLDAASTAAYTQILDWQGLAGYNLHLFFSLHRRNYFKLAGCLGSSEFMDGPQYAKILRGCNRVGMDDPARLSYYSSHVEIDAAHGEAWLANVLVPLLSKYPETRNEIVLGAEMRLNTAADYYDSILRKLISRSRARDIQETAIRVALSS